jgi:Family of unknown function (DUF6331)
VNPSKHRDDISIGPDEWIAFVDINGRHAEAVDLDPMILPMGEFWASLETQCVAGCCGTDAFSFWPEDIERVRRQLPGALIHDQLVQLKHFVQDSRADVFVSHRLNQYFHRQVMTQLLDHLLEHLNN